MAEPPYGRRPVRGRRRRSRLLPGRPQRFGDPGASTEPPTAPLVRQPGPPGRSAAGRRPTRHCRPTRARLAETQSSPNGHPQRESGRAAPPAPPSRPPPTTAILEAGDHRRSRAGQREPGSAVDRESRPCVSSPDKPPTSGSGCRRKPPEDQTQPGAHAIRRPRQAQVNSAIATGASGHQPGRERDRQQGTGSGGQADRSGRTHHHRSEPWMNRPSAMVVRHVGNGPSGDSSGSKGYRPSVDQPAIRSSGSGPPAHWHPRPPDWRGIPGRTTPASSIPDRPPSPGVCAERCPGGDPGRGVGVGTWQRRPCATASRQPGRRPAGSRGG